MRKKTNKILLIIITIILVIAGLIMYIDNQRLNAEIDQQIEEFYSK